MTAAQIVEIVGTERKAWWPTEIEYDPRSGFIWNYTPSQGTGIHPGVAHLAFIGAAVRELARRNVHFSITSIDGNYQTAGMDTGLYTGKDLLSTLASALNESEAT